MKASGLIVGGLFTVIALILYEQSNKTAAQAALPTGAPAPPNTPGETLTGVASGTLDLSAPESKSPSGMSLAAQGLPQFSEAANPSVIDMAASPSFNGTAWTCPNGDIPYYDPSTQTVYCVLPGLVPATQAPQIGSSSLLENLASEDAL